MDEENPPHRPCSLSHCILLVFLVPQLPEVVDLKYIPISRIMHLNKLISHVAPLML